MHIVEKGDAVKVEEDPMTEDTEKFNEDAFVVIIFQFVPWKHLQTYTC